MNTNYLENNYLTLVGKVTGEKKFSHEIYGERFYVFNLEIPRLSGNSDIIPITVSERLIKEETLQEGKNLLVKGQFRSYNSYENEKNRLILTVFAKDIIEVEEPQENEENEITEKVNIVEYYDLPYRYNQTVVKILAQTPNILFVYWDISDTDRNNFISQYGENFFNNTIPVLLIINKTMNYSYEIQINDFANSWYLHVNDANCEYQVELGRRHKENPNYYYVTTSNNLDMPNNHILLENISNNVLFKNVKTQELVEKPITSITFFKDFAKSKDFYKYFKELLNNELEGDEINFNLPSSHTSSSFK
nr:DUF4912 domain-containing protein [uncultured Marvinbryantia sp.]